MNFDLILISNLLPIEIFFIFATAGLCLLGCIMFLSFNCSKLIICVGLCLKKILS